MAAIQEKEKSIVCDALELLRNCVSKSHLTSLSKLPRNGKAASNAGSDALETKLVDRLQGIDLILERLTAAPVDNDISLPSQFQSAPHESIPPVLHNVDAEEEPFLNPFTGQFVFPTSINAPGPSETRRTKQVSSSPVPSSSIVQAEKEEHYKDAIIDVAIQTVTNPDLEDPISPPLDPFKKRASVSNNRLISITSDTTSYHDVYSQLETRPKALSSILSEFDDYFSSITETPQSSKSSFLQARSTTSAGTYSVAQMKEAPHKANEGQHGKQIRRKPLPGNMRSIPSTPSIHVTETLMNPRSRLQQQLEEDRMAASVLLEQDHAEMTKLNADYQLALELAEGFPQDFDDFRTVQSKIGMQHVQGLRTIQEEISKQDQEAYASELAALQAIEDDWNHRYQEAIQAEQARAQQIVEQEAQKETARILEELRLLQDQLQAEEDGQIATDRALALRLSHEPDSAALRRKPTNRTPVFTRSNSPPPYMEYDTVGSKSPKSASPPHGYVDPVLIQPIVNRVVHDFDHDFQLGQQFHDQWRADLQAEQKMNLQAVKAAQKEIESREAQSRQDLDLARSEDRRQPQEQEIQRKLEVEMRLEQERKRKAEMVDCTVCRDPHHRSLTYRFPCTHAYCRDCLAQAINTKVKEKAVFKCCKNRIEMSQASQILSPALASEYANLVQELDTPNPVYCSRRGCSTFIPPASIKAGVAVCTQCQTSTCASCKNASHVGVCKQDHDGQALLKLGSKKGWKSCPKCGTMVERRSGCLHMTCRCGEQFCYSCAKSWSTCQGTCKR